MIVFLIVVTLTTTDVAAQTTNSPLVTTNLGTVKGFGYVTKSNAPAEIFLGIPYARPPVGELRFEPQDPLPFGYLDASRFGSICIPIGRKLYNPQFVPSEDCLTLNVMRPKFRTNAKLPVLVWIHGGSYSAGTAAEFNYTGFADNYIPQDIIVVSIQYRLGVYGFLSVGIPELNGNFALFDQAKALEFVQKYIGAFGGDPKRVTVWGQSAGAATVSLLVLSPISRDMVSGAIEMSGSTFSSWGTGPTVKDNSWEVIVALNCLGLTMKRCLKSRSLDEIYNAMESVALRKNDTLEIVKWGPTLDGDFFPAHPFQLAKEAPKKPIIVGVSDKESANFALVEYWIVLQKNGVPAANQAYLIREKFISIIRETVSPVDFGRNTESARDIMIRKYSPEGQSIGFYINQFILWLSNILFFTPAVDGIIARRDAGWPVYAYRFEHYNPAMLTELPFREAWGSFHTNEYTYMFDKFSTKSFTLTQDDLSVKRQLVSAIASFAKFSKPFVPNMEWPTVGANLKFYIFKAQPEVQNNFYLILFCAVGQIVVPSLAITNLGTVRGFEYTTKKNTLAEIFLGIPFTRPPVGELRFEKPHPPPFGFLDASRFRSPCIPIDRQFMDTEIEPSEDKKVIKIIKEEDTKGFYSRSILTLHVSPAAQRLHCHHFVFFFVLVFLL